MSKSLKYIVGVVIAGIVIYNSVYFQPLDDRLAEGKEVVFDAVSFVEGIWEDELLGAYASATDLQLLLNRLAEDPERTFKEEAHALGIGNIGYFKVKGEGIVQRVNENNIWLQVGDQSIEIETEFIFGNAVRDASGLIQLNDYDKTSDFNSISEAINNKIRKEVVPGFRSKVVAGNKISFEGAMELNKVHLDLENPEIIPLSLEIIP